MTGSILGDDDGLSPSCKNNLGGFLGLTTLEEPAKSSGVGLLATGGPLLIARGLPVSLPVSLLGELLAWAFSGPDALPG